MGFPDGSHPAIFHPLVDLLPGDGAAGNALAACLAGPVASAVSERHGFGTLPSADAR